MDTKYDISVIGSGLSGLVAANIMAKNGFKVAVFEKEKRPGGCLQSFLRGGASFETGMHYIGSMDEGQILRIYFDYLGITKDLTLDRLDVNGYDTIDIYGERYKFANGHQNFIETMSRRFPQVRSQIRDYVRCIHDVTESSPYYSFKNFKDTNILDYNYVKTSVNKYLSNVVGDEKLRNVLTGIIPLYGGVKDKTPFYIHALISDFYINSAFRVVGSSENIATSLINSLRRMGGELFTGMNVTKIICDNTKARFIEFDDKTCVETDYIISSIHPELTIRMLNTPMIRKVYRERIIGMEQTTSIFSVYIKFKDNTVPYLNTNFFKYRCDDVWGCENYNDGSWPKTYLYMHQCHETSQKWAKAAILFGYMNYSDVEKWSGTSVGRRGEEYEEFKQRKAECLLNALEKDFPGTLKNIDDYWTSSPLTYEDYTGTIKGSIYGIVRDVTKDIAMTISQRTKVPNLLLCGQSTNSHGILGVTIGSILTCSEILGRNFLINQIENSILK